MKKQRITDETIRTAMATAGWVLKHEGAFNPSQPSNLTEHWEHPKATITIHNWRRPQCEGNFDVIMKGMSILGITPQEPN